jgi:hypothetical protein
LDAIETRLAKLAWDQLGGDLLTVRAVAGMETA